MLENFIFVGGKELGAECLKYLISRDINVKAVLCREDECDGFVGDTTVCAISQRYGIPNFINERTLIKAVEAPQFGLCVMYPRRLSNEMLTFPRCGFYNFHGAPLPQYRGCMGHAWAIINGEKQYGVTVHKMTAEFDSGAVLKTMSFPIARDETGITLHAKAVDSVFRLFCEAIDLFNSGVDIESMLIPQDESKAAYYSKKIPNNAEINWNQSADSVDKFIRALLFKNVLPPFTLYNGNKIHISGVTILSRHTSERPGTVLDVNSAGLVVATADYAVSVPLSKIITVDGMPKKIPQGAFLGNSL